MTSKDGHFWRKLYQKHFPKSKLSVQNKYQWIDAYLNELNHRSSDLHCFVSKVSWEHDILGMPVAYSINHLKVVDHILPEPDSLSRTAFIEGCRKTAWNHNFQEWCPYYISASHFSRAYPDVRAFIRRLSPESSKKDSPLLMEELDVILRMMNTTVTVMMMSGIINCDRVIEGYFQLYRLLAALVEQEPGLMQQIRDRVEAFVQAHQKRERTTELQMGLFIPLISISRKFERNFNELCSIITEEWLDSQAPWLIMRSEKLRQKIWSRITDPEILAEVMHRFMLFSAVSRKVISFQLHFISAIQGHRTLDDVCVGMDYLRGHAPAQIVKDLRVLTVGIQQKTLPIPGEYIPGFHQIALNDLALKNRFMIGIAKIMTFECNILRKAITPHPIFNRESRVLQHRQSKSLPRNMKMMEVTNTWRWNARTVAVQNLGDHIDTTCHVIDWDKRILASVDYTRKVFRDNLIVHSGNDYINQSLHYGEHHISIDIERLTADPQVNALVFCASSATIPLAEFKYGDFRIDCPDQGGIRGLLYQYLYQQLRAPEAHGVTSIVVACLWRGSARDDWNLTQIEKTGNGYIQSASGWRLLSRHILSALDIVEESLILDQLRYTPETPLSVGCS